MSGRLKLKTEPDVRQHIVDSALEQFRPLIEAEIVKRLPRSWRNDLHPHRGIPR